MYVTTLWPASLPGTTSARTKCRNGDHLGSSREGASGSATTTVKRESGPGGALNETVGSDWVSATE